MNNNKLKSNIGLCYAAKAIVLGTDNIIYSMQKNKVKLILLSSNASFNTQKLVQNKARTNNVPIVMIMENDENILASALGKEKIVVLAITEKNFKNMIFKTIKGV